MPATNTPSTHHPRRQNVTTLMVRLKKRSYTQKSHPKVVNPRDIAGERNQKKKKSKTDCWHTEEVPQQPLSHNARLSHNLTCCSYCCVTTADCSSKVLHLSCRERSSSACFCWSVSLVLRRLHNSCSRAMTLLCCSVDCCSRPLHLFSCCRCEDRRCWVKSQLFCSCETFSIWDFPGCMLAA